MNSEYIQAALAGGIHCVFLSPHLDDAVLSCAALMDALPEGSPTTVVTAFTEPSPPPHTRAARSFLRQCGSSDAATLFAERKEEDREVLDGIGARHVHLGLADALFRRRSTTDLARVLGARVPELVHRYPTYRFDIARARVARADREMAVEIAALIEPLLDESALLFCPLGVGRHVDHVLCRDVGGHVESPVVYYSDFPYNQVHPLDDSFLERHALSASRWDQGLSAKQRRIRGYRTQVDALFPDGCIPVAPETYFTRTSASAARSSSADR